MSEWWAGLSFEQQIYYAIAIVATVLVVFQTALLLVGGADDLADAGDVDMDGPGEHPSGIAIVSSRTVVAFFVGFGWTGVVAAGNRPELAVVAAVLMGLLFGAAIFYLMRALHGLRHSGSLDYHNALGAIGTVYLPIPAAMDGGGRIQVIVQGRLRVVQALTRHPERIESRARVRVVDLVDENTLLVEPLTGGAHQEEV